MIVGAETSPDAPSFVVEYPRLEYCNNAPLEGYVACLLVSGPRILQR